jgi:predicted enzyme related to lactoylglutathione lyase
MPNPVVHFEIPADDVARAIAFYQNVFGWKIKQFSMPAGAPEYYGVTTRNEGAPGINGGLMKRNMPGQPFCNYVDVKSIDDFVGKIQAAGGTVIMPKQEIGPGMGSFAVFQDTEGNMMGLYQAAPAAKKAPAKKSARKSAKKKARRKTRR